MPYSIDSRMEPRIFLSYSRKNANFAAAIRHQIESEGFSVWQDITDLAGGERWRTRIIQILTAPTTEYLILALTKDSLASAAVAEECRIARRAGLHIVPIVEEPVSTLKTLPRWLDRLNIIDSRDKGSRKRFLGQLARPPIRYRVPFGAEELPEGYVERTQELKSLKDAVLHAGSEGVVGLRTAIHGAGGYGKTTMALRLCHDPEVQDHFCDGILWLTIGEHPTASSLCAKAVSLIELLTGQAPRFADLEVAAQALADVLAERELLMVIDDVWSLADARPFLRGGTRCVRLITTRNSDALPPGTSSIVTIRGLRKREALSLLGQEVVANPQRSMVLYRLGERLRGWALILRIVNGVLRERLQRGETVEQAADYVERRLNEQGFATFDRSHEGRMRAVAITIDLSLAHLTPRERTRFRQLAIFPDDTVIPLRVMGALWGEGELAADELCTRLARLSLIDSLTTQGARLHDAIRASLEIENRARLPAWHNALLAAMRPLPAETRRRKAPKSPGLSGSLEDWWSLDAGNLYLWNHLGRHLLGAGRDAAWDALRLDYRWLSAKLKTTHIAALLSDFDEASAGSLTATVAGCLRLSAYALIDDESSLAGQILARLPERAGAAFRRNVIRYAECPCLLPLRPCLTSPGGALIHTLMGHGEPVDHVAMTADATRAVSAGFGGWSLVWDLRIGGALHQLCPDNTINIRSLCLTPDQRWAVFGFEDGFIEIWDFWIGERVKRFGRHRKAVTGLAVGADGILLVSGSEDRSVRVWDLEQGLERSVLTRHKSEVTGVAVLNDGRVVSVGYDGRIRINRIGERKPLAEWQGHPEPIRSVAATLDGATILTGSIEGNVRVWDSRTGELRKEWKGHSDSVCSIAIDGKSGAVVTASDDSTLGVWQLRSGSGRFLLGHSQPVNSVAIGAGGAVALSGSADHTLKLWNLTSPGKSDKDAHSQTVSSLCVAQEGRLVISGSFDRTLRLWDPGTGKSLGILGEHGAWVDSITVSNRLGIAISSAGTEIKVWTLKSKRQSVARTQAAEIRDVAIAERSKLALSGDRTGVVHVWSLADGSAVGEMATSGSVSQILLDPSEAFAIVVAQEQTSLWKMKPLQRVRSWKNREVTHSAALDPSGRHLAQALGSGEVRVIDCHGKQVCHLPGHRGWASFVRWIDKERLVSASVDGTFRLWNIRSRQTEMVYSGHANTVNTVVPVDGESWISVSIDKTARLWDPTTGKCLSVFHGEAAFTSCALAERGVAVLGDEAGGLHFLRVRKSGPF